MIKKKGQGVGKKEFCNWSSKRIQIHVDSLNKWISFHWKWEETLTNFQAETNFYICVEKNWKFDEIRWNSMKFGSCSSHLWPIKLWLTPAVNRQHTWSTPHTTHTHKQTIIAHLNQYKRLEKTRIHYIWTILTPKNMLQENAITITHQTNKKFGKCHCSLYSILSNSWQTINQPTPYC